MNIYLLLKNQITLQELLNYYNASVTTLSLPKSINAFIFKYKSIYNIMVNKNISYYKRKKAILHELAHIELSQLEQLDNKEFFAFKIEAYEDEADAYLKAMQKIVKSENYYKGDFDGN